MYIIISCCFYKITRLLDNDTDIYFQRSVWFKGLRSYTTLVRQLGPYVTNKFSCNWPICLAVHIEEYII